MGLFDFFNNRDKYESDYNSDLPKNGACVCLAIAQYSHCSPSTIAKDMQGRYGSSFNQLNNVVDYLQRNNFVRNVKYNPNMTIDDFLCSDLTDDKYLIVVPGHILY
jgi:hypothetical protein